MFETELTKQPPRLRARLVELALRDRIRDDPGAGAKANRPVLDRERADQDVEIEIAVAVQVAERTRIGTAADLLELGDDLHAAHFWAAGDRSAGEDRVHDLSGCRV